MDKTTSFSFLQPTILLAIALMAIIVMMILPMPAWVLDIGLAASFGLAILMFTVTLFIERPLDFSAFPTVLLASLMLRLSLNVSSTKLIIGEGHTGTAAAGNVIEGFAMFVMNGSIFLGLVVFGVLLIVNFMVITKGAARMAEVGARFALDGMPGKQLAIDSDMSSGAIDHDEAKRRRQTEQLETTFFGSLDGVSKFVKGDAVAGLLITLLNLVMGLVMGVVVHQMDVARAFETYAILTVGDGLVSQIPAVIISIASALLLARGGATGATDAALLRQLGGHPAALGTVGVLMVLFALVPGLPFIPFMFGAITLGGAGFFVWRKNLQDTAEAETKPENLPVAPTETMGDVLDLDDIHVEFAPDLVSMVLDPSSGLQARVENIRRHVATGFGVILPEIRLTDAPSLPDGTYVIRVHGVEQARDTLLHDRSLALVADDMATLPPGPDVAEPVYGAPARWIANSMVDEAISAGATLVGPTEVLATHLLEVIKRNLPRLLGMRSMRRLLDELTNLSDPKRGAANKQMINELIPDKISPEVLLAVLRMLLEERVSIRNLPLILDAIAEIRLPGQTAEAICEHVRQRIGFQLVSELRRADGTIPLIQLAPDWEELFVQYQTEHSGQLNIALPPSEMVRLANAVSQKITSLGETGVYPALITSGLRRRYLHSVLSSKSIPNAVLSYEELGPDAKPSLVGTVAA